MNSNKKVTNKILWYNQSLTVNDNWHFVNGYTCRLESRLIFKISINEHFKDVFNWEYYNWILDYGKQLH